MRDKSYDTKIVRDFFCISVTFFSKDVPHNEAKFKHEFHCAHSDWIDIGRMDPETLPIKASLIKPLIELFDKAKQYFYAVVGSPASYETATFVNAQKWAEIQALAKAILKEYSQ